MKKWTLETVIEQLNTKTWELLNEDIEDQGVDINNFLDRLITADFDRRRSAVRIPGQVTIEDAIAEAGDVTEEEHE